MSFSVYRKELQEMVKNMIDRGLHLFTVEVDKDELWNLYLDSFNSENNKIFRERREFDCSCCRHFIKDFGNVVAINANKLVSIWDFTPSDDIFIPVNKALSEYIHSKKINSIFISKTNKIGTDVTRELAEDNKIINWEHFYVAVPQKFVNTTSESNIAIVAPKNDARNVFKRSLEEITEDSIRTVLELISQNSLYKGEEWEGTLKSFLKLHKEYHSIESLDEKENYCWHTSIEVGPVVSKIKNHSMGVLLSDISQGVELNEAVRKYEAIVAPTNYKRPKAIFTKKMLEDAQKKLEEQGLIDSLGRRFATLDDITVNNILYSNRDSKKRIEGSVFDEMSSDASIGKHKFDRLETVKINDFVTKILPSVKNMEVYFENKHNPNLVSLIAPKIKNSKTLFKWNNGFSWAYKGNITDSIKERVKNLGGKVDGVLRFSIQWNDGEYNPNDFDAHCIEPSRNEICFYQKRNPATSGMLDVDIIHPENGVTAVENITWQNKSKMGYGEYKFFVHNYSNRGGRTGFSAEIEYEGQVYLFNYNKELRQNEDVQVASVFYSKQEGFSIKEKLPSSTSSRTIWGLSTNKFHPVSVFMYSPNYWDEQDGIGNRHYLFMLKDCIDDEEPNGFFNEFLKEDLLEHKRVFEALGSKMKVEDSKDQLSGLGFSSTKPDSLVVKVEGSVNRILKIQF